MWQSNLAKCFTPCIKNNNTSILFTVFQCFYLRRYTEEGKMLTNINSSSWECESLTIFTSVFFLLETSGKDKGKTSYEKRSHEDTCYAVPGCQKWKILFGHR